MKKIDLSGGSIGKFFDDFCVDFWIGGMCIPRLFDWMVRAGEALRARLWEKAGSRERV